jgi:hypothetical protein
MPHRDQIILLRSGSIILGSDVALGPKTVLILIAAGMMSSLWLKVWWNRTLVLHL